jgi:hypothetical protein
MSTATDPLLRLLAGGSSDDVMRRFPLLALQLLFSLISHFFSCSFTRDERSTDFAYRH